MEQQITEKKEDSVFAGFLPQRGGEGALWSSFPSSSESPPPPKKNVRKEEKNRKKLGKQYILLRLPLKNFLENVIFREFERQIFMLPLVMHRLLDFVVLICIESR